MNWYAQRSITCTIWTESKLRLYVDQSQWILSEIVVRRNGQTGALFERMVYDGFIVGPRCSAAVFNILSRRFQLPRLFPSTSEKELGFYFSTIHIRKKSDGGGGAPSDRFIKVVWHICSPRLLPRPRVGNARERETRNILFYLLFHFKAASRPFSSLSLRIFEGLRRTGIKYGNASFCVTLGSPRISEAPARDVPYGTTLSTGIVHVRILIKPTFIVKCDRTKFRSSSVYIVYVCVYDRP